MNPKLPHVRGLAWLVLVVLAAIAAPAAADPIDDAIRAGRERLIDDLQAVNDWAGNKRISGFRHRVYRLMIRIDPECRKARKVLGYSRKGKDDPWVPDPNYREPADWNKGVLDKAQERVTQALERYRDAVLAALDARPDTPLDRRDGIVEELVDLLPNDRTLREGRGDVEVDGRWVLPETPDAELARAELRTFAKQAAAAAKKRVREHAAARAKGWNMAYETDERRVIGQVERKVGMAALLGMEAADALCTKLFGTSKTVRGPKEAIFVTTRDEARDLVRRTPEWREILENLELVSSLHTPTGEYLSYRSSAETAVTGAIRSVIDSGLKRRFQGKRRGWVTEGVGQRLTWYVSGAHGPSFVSLKRTERLQGDESYVVSLPDDPAAWPHAAAAVLKREGAPCLAALLTKRLNAMRPADVLVAYGLAAFLLETRPDEFPRFVEATSTGHDAKAIFESTLGADSVELVATRLRRWLLEYR